MKPEATTAARLTFAAWSDPSIGSETLGSLGASRLRQLGADPITIGHVTGLREFELAQQFDSDRRVMAVALQLRDQFALLRNVLLALGDVTFGLFEVADGELAIHAGHHTPAMLRTSARAEANGL